MGAPPSDSSRPLGETCCVSLSRCHCRENACRHASHSSCACCVNGKRWTCVLPTPQSFLRRHTWSHCHYPLAFQNGSYGWLSIIGAFFFEGGYSVYFTGTQNHDSVHFVHTSCLTRFGITAFDVMESVHEASSSGSLSRFPASCPVAVGGLLQTAKAFLVSVPRDGSRSEHQVHYQSSNPLCICFRRLAHARGQLLDGTRYVRTICAKSDLYCATRGQPDSVPCNVASFLLPIILFFC